MKPHSLSAIIKNYQPRLHILLLFLSSCAASVPEHVTNDIGGYSLDIQPGWTTVTEGSNMQALASHSLIVSATVSVTVFDSEYDSLTESFEEYVAQLPPGFEDYKSYGNGATEINKIPARWHKMSDTEDGKKFMNLMYVLQPVGKQLYVISCSSIIDDFAKYEQDFTKMIFSFKIKSIS
jgi:hypothetical protein